MNNILRLTLLCFLMFQMHIEAQNPSALYQNWVDAEVNSTEPILPTFSYAGYRNGEIGIPSSFTQQVYDITQSSYNAVVNDGISDKTAIMSAIAATEASGKGGIIFFPPGKFIVNDASVDDSAEVIRINHFSLCTKGVFVPSHKSYRPILINP